MSSRRQMLLVLAVSVLATAPVWIPTFPPMADLPQHAAQISLLENLDRPQFRFGELFTVNWFTPYLFGYLLLLLFQPLGGIVVAVKIVVTLALVSLPMATALVAAETGADRRWALLAIPAYYGFSYQWGFLNFLVAAPLGLVFLALVMRHARRATVTTHVGVGLLLVFLFFCHAMICVFFGAMAGIYLLLEVGNPRAALLRILPMVPVVPIALLWGLKSLANPLARFPMIWDLGWFHSAQSYYRSSAAWADGSGWGWGRTAGFLPRLLGTQPGLLALAIGALLFAYPLLAGARPSRRWSVWSPFLVCAAVLLFAPHRILGTDFTFQRFTVFALPLYLVALGGSSPARRSRLVWAGCVAIVVGWVAFVSLRTQVYQQEADGFGELLDRMAPGQRALSLVFLRDSSVSIAPTFLHYPSWYSALKDGVVDPSFGGMHVELVRYRPETRPRAGVMGFEWGPGTFDWRLHRGADYRYFVVRAPADVGGVLFREAPCAVRLVHQVNDWWLYERSSDCSAAPASR